MSETQSSLKSGPLAGVRVLEIASMIFGPVAGQYLGDLGAEVVKLEPPEGDLTRSIGPRRSPKMGAFFLSSNRSKRSIVVDLKSADGREVLSRLLMQTDVLLHSLRKPAAIKLGIDYPSVSKAHPNMVYCHVKGYSDHGLLGGLPSYDDIGQAASGLADLQSVIAGQPRFVPTILADKLGAVHAAMGMVAAILHQQRTGQGQQVDVAMFEGLAAFNMIEHQWGHVFEPPLGPMGYQPVSTASRRPYKTLDGYIALLPYSDEHWRSFFKLAGEPQIMEDPRFATFPARQKYFREVWAEIERQAARKTNAEWLSLLSTADVPHSVVNRLEDLPANPHLESIHFWTLSQHPSEGMLRYPGTPIDFSESPMRMTRMQPKLGEHSGEILKELGYAERDIQTMLGAGGCCKGNEE